MTEQVPESILVADSEVLVRHAIADYLRHCGYTVIEAATSNEAMTILTEPKLAVDAVLCDAKLSGSLNGFGLLQWTQRQRPGLQVILSGSITSAANAAADLCEQGPHLARPYDPQGVVDYIKRLLAARER